MFTKKTKPEPTELEKTLSDLMREMASLNGDSPEYANMAENLVKLYKLKEVDQDSKKQLSYDAILAASANIAGILIIVGYEHKNALSSKALGFVQKLR